MNVKKSLGYGITGLAGLAFSAGALAADGSQKPLDKRFYIAPMISYGFFDQDTVYHNNGTKGKLERDNDIGGTLAFGKPINKWLNLELYGFYFNPDQQFKTRGTPAHNNYHTGNGEIWGVGMDAMFFPARETLPIYGLLGASFGKHGVNTPTGFSSNGDLQTDQDHVFTRYLDAGVGYVYPITSYGIKVRAEYRFRYTEANSSADTSLGHVGDADFKDNIVSVGLQIPLGAPPQAEPVKAAPAPEPADDDGDGVINANDQCPNTPAGAQVDATGCQIQTKAAPITLRGVTFNFDKSSLTQQANSRLSSVVNALNASPDVDFRIDGYTDSVGSSKYNQGLSQRRVNSVRSYLLNHDISQSRISGTEGHGESNPVATNKTKAGRAQNRRVELNVTNQQ